MVIASLVAFVVLLAAIVVLLARLWQDDPLVPAISNGPGLAVGIADSVPLDTGGGPSLARASVAAGDSSGLAVSAPAPVAGSGADVGVSDSRPVSIGPGADTGNPPPGPVGAPDQPAPGALDDPPAESAPAAPAPVVVADSGENARRPGIGSEVPPRTAGTPVPGVGGAAFDIAAGGEYRLDFSFISDPVVFRQPGEENLLLRLRSDGAERPSLGLQLWEFPGEEWYGTVAQGLWASGEAMGLDRFLAPVEEDVWHQVSVDFRASAEADGYYVISLDGRAIDARAPVALIAPGGSAALLEVGLFREEPVERTRGLSIFGARLTETAEPTPP